MVFPPEYTEGNVFIYNDTITALCLLMVLVYVYDMCGVR